MSSILTRNKQSRQNSRLTSSSPLQGDELAASVQATLNGSQGETMNAKAVWYGFTSNGLGRAKIGSKIFVANSINGIRGLPRNTPVVVRAVNDYLTIDFQ